MQIQYLEIVTKQVDSASTMASGSCELHPDRFLRLVYELNVGSPLDVR